MSAKSANVEANAIFPKISFFIGIGICNFSNNPLYTFGQSIATLDCLVRSSYPRLYRIVRLVNLWVMLNQSKQNQGPLSSLALTVSAQHAPLPVPANYSQTRLGISLCSLSGRSLQGRDHLLVRCSYIIQDYYNNHVLENPDFFNVIVMVCPPSTQKDPHPDSNSKDCYHLN